LNAFPSAIVEKNNLVSIYAINLASILIACVPISALFDEPAPVPEDIDRFLGIEIHLFPIAVVHIIISGTALYAHISPRVIQYLLAIDTINEISVRVGKIPGATALNTIISVVKQVNLIAIEYGITVPVYIYLSARETNSATIP
jgi:hypothetical protein